MSRPTYCIKFYVPCVVSLAQIPSSQTVQKTNLENDAHADAHSQPQIRTSKEIRKS